MQPMGQKRHSDSLQLELRRETGESINTYKFLKSNQNHQCGKKNQSKYVKIALNKNQIYIILYGKVRIEKRETAECVRECNTITGFGDNNPHNFSNKDEAYGDQLEQ